MIETQHQVSIAVSNLVHSWYCNTCEKCYGIMLVPGYLNMDSNNEHGGLFILCLFICGPPILTLLLYLDILQLKFLIILKVF